MSSSICTRHPRCPCRFSPVPGLQEANNISLYLQPLQILLEEMEQAEYFQVSSRWRNSSTVPTPGTALLCPLADRALLPQLRPYIDRVLCTVCLTWVHSEHYSTPSRIIVILQEICNLLIEMVWGVAQGAEPHAWCAGLQGTTRCSRGSPCPQWLFSVLDPKFPESRGSDEGAARRA